MYAMKNMILNPDVEMWAMVEEAGFEGLYEVSSFGRVRKVKNGRMMKQYSNGNGYLKVDFCSGGKRAKLYVHRLVAKAFVPNTNPKLFNVCNHLDENPLNNHADNLEWTTMTANLNYGTAKERKEITRALDSELKEGREKLQREIDALTLKKINYSEQVDDLIAAKKAEIEKINSEVERRLEEEARLKELAVKKIAREKIKQEPDYRSKLNKEYYQEHREEILANAKARKENMSAEELEALKEKKRAYDKARNETKKAIKKYGNLSA